MQSHGWAFLAGQIGKQDRDVDREVGSMGHVVLLT
jgi:hypothetical protein